MGADCFLKTKHDELAARLQPRMDALMEVMDTARAKGMEYDPIATEPDPDFPGNTRRVRLPAYKIVFDEWEGLYDQLYGGDYYFRDSYNGSSVLNRLDLSWWQDVGPMLDDEGNLSVEQAQVLRDTIARRVLVEPEWKGKRREGDGTIYLALPTEAELRADYCRLDAESTVVSWYSYYQDKRLRLIAFLDRAITLDSPIVCSI
jgi:hypothetical protein